MSRKKERLSRQPGILCLVLMGSTFLASPVWAADNGGANANADDPRVAIVVRPLLVRGSVDRKSVEGLEIVVGGAVQEDPRVRAILPSEIATLIGLEAQKEVTGCGEDSSCMAELGGALGASYVLSPQISKVGDVYLLQVALIDVAGAETLGRASSQVTELNQLIKALQTAVRKVLKSLPQTVFAGAAASAAAVNPVVTPPQAVAPSTGGRGLFWLGVSGAGVGIAGGALLAGLSQSTLGAHNEVASAGTVLEKRLTKTQAQTQKTLRGVGLGIAGLGAAGLVGALLWGGGHAKGEAELTLLPTERGVLLLAGGRFP